MTSWPITMVDGTLVVHTEGVITLPAETWATIGTLLAALVGLYVALRAEIHREIGRVETRIDSVDLRLDRIEIGVERLDDRVYALAAGLRPQVEAARADDS
jgi:hypothetical protein